MDSSQIKSTPIYAFTEQRSLLAGASGTRVGTKVNLTYPGPGHQVRDRDWLLSFHHQPQQFHSLAFRKPEGNNGRYGNISTYARFFPCPVYIMGGRFIINFRTSGPLLRPRLFLSAAI